MSVTILQSLLHNYNLPFSLQTWAAPTRLLNTLLTKRIVADTSGIFSSKEDCGQLANTSGVFSSKGNPWDLEHKKGKFSVGFNLRLHHIICPFRTFFHFNNWVRMTIKCIGHFLSSQACGWCPVVLQLCSRDTLGHRLERIRWQGFVSNGIFYLFEFVKMKFSCTWLFCKNVVWIYSNKNEVFIYSKNSYSNLIRKAILWKRRRCDLCNPSQGSTRWLEFISFWDFRCIFRLSFYMLLLMSCDPILVHMSMV